MNDRLYDRLANLFMLIAVCSALLFDLSSRWHILVGAAGIAAGVGAFVLYYRNHPEGPTRVENVAAPNVAGVRRRQLATAQIYWPIADAPSLHEYAYEALRANIDPRDDPWAYWATKVVPEPVLQAEAQLTPDEFAKFAIEIIRNLSMEEDQDRWQFSFGPKGFGVIPAHQPLVFRQTDFDFEPVSRMVN